ncbi:MAG: hypothetical protein V1784_12560 [bacterium]
MIHFGTSQAEGLQEILFIAVGMVVLFLFCALIMFPGSRRGPLDEPSMAAGGPTFEPRKNGRGTFYPWVPVA